MVLKKPAPRAMSWEPALSYCIISLLNNYDQILAGRPEEVRIGDAEHILLVGITLQGVGA